MEIWTSGTSGNPRLKRWLVGGLSVLALACAPAARANGPETTLMNSAMLIQMENQADHAKPRDQCYLYTQLVNVLTDTASRQVAAGLDEDAAKTVVRIAEVTAKLEHAAARDTKKLKDAEKILSESARKLTELARVASGEQRDEVKAVAVKLDAAHNKILGLVFLQ
jgi:hypothetical protein